MNGNTSSEVWFSNDYGNNFYNMNNGEINFLCYVSVSPDGNYILIYDGTNIFCILQVIMVIIQNS